MYEILSYQGDVAKLFIFTFGSPFLRLGCKSVDAYAKRCSNYVYSTMKRYVIFPTVQTPGKEYPHKIIWINKGILL